MALERTLDSLRRQLFARWQVLVIGAPNAQPDDDDRIVHLASASEASSSVLSDGSWFGIVTGRCNAATRSPRHRRRASCARPRNAHGLRRRDRRRSIDPQAGMVSAVGDRPALSRPSRLRRTVHGDEGGARVDAARRTLVGAARRHPAGAAPYPRHRSRSRHAASSADGLGRATVPYGEIGHHRPDTRPAGPVDAADGQYPGENGARHLPPRRGRQRRRRWPGRSRAGRPGCGRRGRRAAQARPLQLLGPLQRAGVILQRRRARLPQRRHGGAERGLARPACVPRARARRRRRRRAAHLSRRPPPARRSPCRDGRQRRPFRARRRRATTPAGPAATASCTRSRPSPERASPWPAKDSKRSAASMPRTCP